MNAEMKLPYLISLTPGEAYVSSWRDPLRKRNSIAEKSLLSTLMFFSNSVLHSNQHCALRRKVSDLTHLAKALK